MQEPCLLYIFKSLEKFQAKKKKKIGAQTIFVIYN